MAAFDIQITLGAINVQVQTDGENPAHFAELGLLVALPIAPEQAIPLGQVRVPLTVEAVDDLIAKLTEARTHMTVKSNIAVANSLQGVEEAAAFQRGLRS